MSIEIRTLLNEVGELRRGVQLSLGRVSSDLDKWLTNATTAAAIVKPKIGRVAHGEVGYIARTRSMDKPSAYFMWANF